MSNNLNLKQASQLAKNSLLKVQRYSFVLFLIFVLVIYGFILLRINTLSSMAPSEEAITTQTGSARVLRIDQSVLHQLQSLQDNSVSVKTLFEDARNNPFQE